MANAKDPKMQFRYNGKVFNWNKDMVKLSVDDLALVEYRLENTTVFKKMFLKKVGGLCCQICSTNAMSGKASMDGHINGKKHQRAIELVVEYKHKTIKSLAEEAAAKTKAAPAAPMKCPPAPTITKGTPVKAVAGADATKPAATPASPKPVAKAAATPATPKPAAAVGTPKTPTTPGATKPAATPKSAPTPGAPKPAGAATTPAATKAGAAGAKPVGTPAKPAAAGAAKPGTPAAKPATPAPRLAAGAAKPAAGTTPATKLAAGAAKPAAGTTTPATPGAAKPAAPKAPIVKSATPAAKAAVQPTTQLPATKVEVKDEEPTPMETDDANVVADNVTVNEPDIEVVDLLSDSEETPVTKAEADNGSFDKTDGSTPTKPTETAKTPNENQDEPTEKQLNALKSALTTLGLSDLKKVKYSDDGENWVYIISEFRGTYSCNICKEDNLKSFYELKTHMNQEHHKNKIEQLQYLSHPVICPMNPTKLPINDGSDLRAKEREYVSKNVKVTGPVPLEEFRIKHVLLSVPELLKVEYRGKSNIWYSMISKTGSTYKCVLCKTPFMGNFKNIVEHVHGKKHLLAANEVISLHHPVYCIASDRTENFANDSQVENVGKENLVINPIAVMKGSGDTPRQKTPPPPTGKKIPTVARNETQQGKRPATAAAPGGPQNKRQALTAHPGLQQQNQQTKGPSFSNKVITNKPETDAHIEGYIGVEYVVKILRTATDPSPRFECCLCELESDGYGMQSHLKSSQHRLKYLDRHFRTVMREFENLRNDPTCKNVLAEIARLLAIAIEKHHGRDLPFECLQEEYRINRPEIMSKVFSFRHASELSGPSMVHVIDKMTLNEMLQNKDAYGQVHAEPKRRTTFDVRDEMASKRVRIENENYLDVDEHRRLVDQFLRNTNRDNDRRHRSRSRGARSRSRGRSRDRWEQGRNRRSRSRSMGRRRSHSGDRWTVYKRMFDHSIRDLDTDYKRFERDPETHPLYQKEWKIFWQKRSEELANDGRDPTNYDFQPEWILFWTRRMDQIYEEEVDHLKKRLRDRLNLPYHNNDLRERRYHLGVHRQSNSAFSQIRQSMDNIGPVGPNIPNLMGVDAPPMEGPGGPFMGGADGARMGGPQGPFMGGPNGPRMGGPGGPIIGGPGGQHMGGPGGPGMGGPVAPLMGGPQMGGPGGPHMGGPGGPHMGGPGGPNMGGPPMGAQFGGGPRGPHMGGPGGPGGFNMGGPSLMGPGGDNAQFNRNQPHPGQWSGPNFGPHQNNKIPDQVIPNPPVKQQPMHRTIKSLLPAEPQQNNNTGPKPPQQQQQQQKQENQSAAAQRQRAEQAKRDELEKKRIEQQREAAAASAKNAKNIKQQVDNRDSRRNESMHVEDDLMDSSPLTVLSVLRLLAALEDHLGILGPRVVDLMAKALTLEKAKPGSADKNLLTAENTVFLETVREKLRGQIVVGVLDASKTRAVNNAIKVLTELLNRNISNEPPQQNERVEVNKQQQQQHQQVPMAPSRVTQPKPTNSNEADEKRDLATKLAAALAAQGKTNVTSDQLEQLIAVYSLIEKKQKETANEPKKQNLSDLLVDSLKETTSKSGENDSRSDANRGYDNRGPQKPPSLMDIQPYGTNSPSSNRQYQSSGGNPFQSNNSGYGNSSSNLPSFMSSSFSLSNFDTSLSLSSLPPLSYSRNQDSSRQLSNSNDNSPAYMTNMGRSSTTSKQDMISYPSIWQRGSSTTTTTSTTPTNRNQSSSQQAPLGWQQNNNTNRNSGNWAQNRSRR